MIRRHLAAMIDYYDPTYGLILFRKHVVKYIKGVPGIGAMHLPLVTCTTADEFIALFSQWEAYNLDQPLPIASPLPGALCEASEFAGEEVSCDLALAEEG